MMNGNGGSTGQRMAVRMLTVIIVTVTVACTLAVRAGRVIVGLQSVAPMHRPIVIAHRGDSSLPENSVQAIRAASGRYADYAEVDVRLTSDGVPVVFHDRKTGRMSSSGRDVTVAKIPLKTLEHMPMRQRGETFHVPTLRQILFEADHTLNAMGLLLDIKTDDRHAEKIADAVIRDVERSGFGNRLMVMSANRKAVRQFKQLRPKWTVGLCASGNPELVDWRNWQGLPLDFVVLRGCEASNALLRAARASRIPVYAGSVNDVREARALLRRGVSGLLGDSVRPLRDAVTADADEIRDVKRLMTAKDRLICAVGHHS